MLRKPLVLIALAAAAPALCTAPARATWSIILIDTRTGEVAIGSATCLTNFDLQANTPVMLTGIGGATAQSAVDSTGQNRVFIRDRLLAGVDPAQIVTQLAGFDGQHQSRQYGIADDRLSGRAATFTGSGAGQYRGGRTGRIIGGGVGGGDIVYAIQGNVLTGAPVIDMAVDAVTNTPGDLAAKLMAGMQAARRMGGDGRCSCDPANPTRCGSPPLSFVKSAHIAYMIISRAGDPDGCNGIYRTGTTPSAVAAADLNGDGHIDLATANQSANTVSVLLNNTINGTPTFGLPMNYTAAAGPRDVKIADINGDGFPDVIVGCSSTAAVVSVFPGSASGTLGARTDYTIGAGAGIVSLALGDFDHDGHTDIAAVTNTAAAVTILLGNGSGGFTPAPPIPLGTGASTFSIGAADLDADGDTDLVVGSSVSNGVIILRNNATPPGGPLAFTVEPVLAAGRGVNSVAIADFNGDARPDIATAANTDGAIDVLLQLPSGAFAPAVPYNVSSGIASVVAGDVSGDGVPDLVALVGSSSSTRMAVLPASAGGVFLAPRFAAVGFGSSRLTLADLDGDGDLDAAVALLSTGSAMVIQNIGAGQFNNGIGCATGGYFMDFNIAFQFQDDPDPVFTLQARYDQWRDLLQTVPDAVRSTASFDRAVLPANGIATTTLTIRPRDWAGSPAPASSVTVGHAPDSAGIASIGPVMAHPDGTFTALLTAGNRTGLDRFIVRMNNAVRPVVLMPEPGIRSTGTADWDHNGIVNSDDFFAFVTDFLAGNGDFDGDGHSNSADFFAFLEVFFNG